VEFYCRNLNFDTRHNIDCLEQALNIFFFFLSFTQSFCFTEKILTLEET